MLVGENFGVGFGFLDGFGVIRPTGRNGGEALRFEKRAPVIPTAGEQPQAVYKDNRLQAGIVGTFDLLLFVRGKGHEIKTPLANVSMSIV
jgi:hypothetical protein